ncbi:HpcH/HpaI aldolase family protein [Saccharopolyspora mangrovi]|uniref:Aldolase/citrate lyase family protein n=1 Tax=Saccharopolyspora mangrovi TaxID=3082379 RepID=A0ABU6A713_9PSEU|nr:aldolase/citrate lyase family protein [Saccharopolyspora sp. S2-29]MEB3367248.1 aldolase/citrate lyase family protein [Saccharopolyspora sp. S2-29]
MTTLKQRVHAGERLHGALLRLPSETLLEMAAVAGLDYAVIDCEHGPADLLSLQQHLQIAAAHDLPVLVRVGEREPALVLRVLDLGAQGVIVPHVDTPEQAREVVAAAHYPPLGERGFATYSRAGRFGTNTIAEHLAAAERTTMVIPMLETPLACENTADILAVPGVDTVLVGPADLSVAMGKSGPADPAVAQRLAQVVEAAGGRPLMTIVGSTEQGAQAPPGMVLHNLTHVLMQLLRTLKP